MKILLKKIILIMIWSMRAVFKEDDRTMERVAKLKKAETYYLVTIEGD